MERYAVAVIRRYMSAMCSGVKIACRRCRIGHSNPRGSGQSPYPRRERRPEAPGPALLGCRVKPQRWAHSTKRPRHQSPRQPRLPDGPPRNGRELISTCYSVVAPQPLNRTERYFEERFPAAGPNSQPAPGLSRGSLSPEPPLPPNSHTRTAPITKSRTRRERPRNSPAGMPSGIDLAATVETQQTSRTFIAFI